MTGARRRLVIVGGGISGLAAAWEASIGGTLDVTVLDDGGAAVVPPSSRPDIGGKLRTSPVGGVATDEAADMFLARVPEGLALADELGLSDRLTAPVAGGAAIWMDGAAHPMPTGLVLGVPTDPHALGGSGLLEADDIQAVRSELVRTGRPVVEDRSIGSLIRERLGDRIADRLVQPLLGGINAGVIDRLSLAAAAPQLDVAARSGPSLTGALAATRRAAGPPSTTPAFYGLPGGMTELVTTLRTALSTRGVRLRDAVRVESVERAGGELRMVVASTRTGARAAIAADAVILAVPAAAAAALLARTEPTEPSHWAGAPETAAVLGGFRSASVAMVRLAVRPDRVRVPAGRAGLLVPHRSGFATVAVSYASTKWAHLAEDGLVRLRISVGHDDDPDSPRLPEDELVTRVLDEARTLTGLDGPVEHHSLVRWHDAFPQYDVGHLDRCATVDAALAEELPNVLVTGASYRGIGIPGCIRQGRRAAAAVMSG